MILSCNSCGKKFVVPDQAITPSGRLVQCGSCGNKWKQFPVTRNKVINETIEETNTKKTPSITRIPKPRKKRVKKSREINLYSPEYLAKKHGITLTESEKVSSSTNNTSFGFYNSIILLLFLVIIFSRSLYFFQDIIVQKLPFTEYCINYFFESIRNMLEIWKNLISNY